jgi:flagellar hook-length control protein FliK
MDVTQFISALESGLPLSPGLTQTQPTLSTAVAQKPLPSGGALPAGNNFEAFLASAVQQADAAAPASPPIGMVISSPPQAEVKFGQVVAVNTVAATQEALSPPLPANVTALSPILWQKAILTHPNQLRSPQSPATSGLATPEVPESQADATEEMSQGPAANSTFAEEVVPPQPAPTTVPVLPTAYWATAEMYKSDKLPSSAGPPALNAVEGDERIVASGRPTPDVAHAKTQPGVPAIQPGVEEITGTANQLVVAEEGRHRQQPATDTSFQQPTNPVVIASLSQLAGPLEAVPPLKPTAGAKLAASPSTPRQVPGTPNETAINAAVVNPGIVANMMPSKQRSLRSLDKGETGSLLPVPPTLRLKSTAGKPPVAPVSGLPEDMEQSVKEPPDSLPPSLPIPVAEIAPLPAAAGLGIVSPVVRENRPGVVVTEQGNNRSNRIHAVITKVLLTATRMSLPVAMEEKPPEGMPSVSTFSSNPTSSIDLTTNVSPPAAHRTAALSPPVQQENSAATGKTEQGHDVAPTALPTPPVPIVVTVVGSDRMHAVPSQNAPINRVTTNHPRPDPKRDLLVPAATLRPSVGKRDTVGDRVTTSGTAAPVPGQVDTSAAFDPSQTNGTINLPNNDSKVLATSVRWVERPATPFNSPTKKGAAASLLPVPPKPQSKNTGGKPPVAPFSDQVEDFQQAPTAIHTVIGAAPSTSEGPGGVPHQPNQSGTPDPSNNWLRVPSATAATVEERAQGTPKAAASPIIVPSVPPSSPPQVKEAAYSPAANPGKTGLPAMPSQPEGGHAVEQPADYPEDSLQASPHPAATFASKVLAFARGMTSADKTNKFEPTEAGTQATKDLPAAHSNASSVSPLHTLGAPTVLQSGDHAIAPGPGTGTADKIANAIASQAETLASDGHTTLHLQLDPPGLGSVRVHLSASDHAVSARLVVQDESTRQILESQVGLLRDKLQESGVTLGRFAVTRDGGGAPGKDQQAPDSWSPALRRFSSGKPPNGATSARTNGPPGVIDVIA